MRVRLLIAVVALPLLLWAALPLGSEGATPQQELSELERKLANAREKVGRKKGAERTLTGEIAGYTRRIDRLQGRIGTLQERQGVIEVDLDAKRSELERLRRELRDERARLARLRKRLNVARRTLRKRLVEIYKADPPDLVTVILNSDGFADLLERSEFIKRISDQDRAVIKIVREARADAVRTERRLDRLEVRQREVTAIVQARRDEVADVKMELIGTRVGFTRTKDGKSNALQKVRGDRRELEQHVDGLEAASAKVQRKLGAVAPGAGPIRSGSGSMIFPVNGAITSGFGPRWGRLHAGIDIGAAEGTPIRAADSGKVVLMQGTGASGGYGNYTCVQHSGSLATCYAHQSRFGTSQGANVSKGQVIGYVGNTGNSFGAHLHFETRVNGVPQNPMNYL